MTGTLTMSMKERERLKVIHRIDNHELTVALGAEALHLSERQLYRILKRYRQHGDAGILHRQRGQPSHRAYPAATKAKALRLYRERYADYGPKLFSEMLEEHHNLTIAPETLRRWLMANGLWAGSRKKRPHRKRRPRREAIGSLVQLDGSLHDWFEGRGPTCTLLVFIDDASDRSYLRFVNSENTAEVFSSIRLYFERYGIPQAFYTDFGGVFYGEEKPTEYQRAMRALGVETRFAKSPQAKGRVERSNRTHQDRLVKALRRHRIKTIAAANRFLEKSYLKKHNDRFAACDNLSDLHRSCEGIDLDNILCFETKRQVHNDYTITLNAQYIQLLRGSAPLPPPKCDVTIRQWLDGSLHLFYNDQELDYQQLNEKPKRPHPRPRPAEDHPWRRRALWRRQDGKRTAANSSNSTSYWGSQKDKSLDSLP
jgi:hypothetical protein